MTDENTDATGGRDDRAGALYDALEAVGRPLLTAARYGQLRDLTQAAATERLEALAEEGVLERVDVSNDPVVWYPTEWQRLTDRERVILFPERRELVVDQPEQFTRAQLSQFAHLVDTTGSGAYRYEIRREDVWQAPYDSFQELLGTVRNVLPERDDHLEGWLEEQWRRANQFTLRTHEDGYTVLEAASADLMGNVARQELDDDQLRAPMSETESWVAEDAVASVKRVLYEAGYPVRDERDLETGEELPAELELDLRAYQHEWVSQFLETRSGILVGPPGSGKTVAAMGILAAIEGETLVLVPGRELAGQWRDALLAHTSLTDDQIGEYHGGAKEIRPVTIATYRTAGMDRHRQLFDSREWGLIVYDEVHHIPSDVYRRSADLQTRHRLGLSVDGDTILPIRRDGDIEMVRIEVLVTEYLDEEVGTTAVNELETLAVTDDGDVEWTRVQSVMRHEHGGEMYRVRSRNGRDVTVTPDHSVIVFDGVSLELRSKRPEELSEQDYLVQPESVPLDGERDSIDVLSRIDEGYVRIAADAPESLFDPLYERDIGDNKSRYNWKTRRNLPLDVAQRIGVDRCYIEGVYIHGRHSYIPPSVSIDDFARLVGLFVADGALGEHRVEFYAADEKDYSEVDEFEEVIRGVCPDVEISTVSNGPNCTTLRVSGPLRHLLESVELSNGARDKSISSCILSNPAAHEPFIEGIVLGDGHHQERDRNREMTTVSTSSESVHQGLNFVLSSLGHVGGNYRRETEVSIRERNHDTVENNLVRFNPNNRAGAGRLSMTPFTQQLQEAYEGITRYASEVADGGYTLESGLSRRARVNDEELATLCERSEADCEWLLDSEIALLEIDEVEPVGTEEYVYDISTEHENFLGNHLFCHNSSTPVREDDREADIYTLIGPPIGTDWDALFDAGYVAEPEVDILYVPWNSEDAQNKYVSAEGHERRQLAASNPAKVDEIQRLLARHPEQKALVFVEYLDQGETVSDRLEVPFVSGETPHHRREKLFERFRTGDLQTLVVSRVGDEGIDLPNAELAIVASGLGGSRRQGAQRAGRTMRPTGRARMYVLATRGTREEEFARRRMRHLSEKGVKVTERDAEAVGDGE